MAIEIPLSIKYRPKKLSDVIGQEVVVKSLTNALKSKTLHHAYIFEGNLGSGKTSVSRILAAMENCEKAPTIEPCGTCNNCISIFAGKSIDVKEVDAASNRGIDDIRQIKEEIKLHPVYGNVKYVIIDEAASLTGFAAEAALKMIEEPPQGVRFVLATTDAHKLIDTIRSRCISFKFHKVNWMLMYEHLQKIVELEKIICEDEVLKLISKNSKGSVRDSLQYLQTLINYVGDEKITLDIAKEVLGSIDSDLYFKLINAIVTMNIPASMILVNNLFLNGKDVGSILNGLYEHLNNLSIIANCSGSTEDCLSKLGYSSLDNFYSYLGFSINEIKKYNYQLSTFQKEHKIVINKFIDMLAKVNAGIELNIDPQILLNQYIINSMIYFQKTISSK